MQLQDIKKKTTYLLAGLLICTMPAGCSSPKGTSAAFEQDTIQQDTENITSAERNIFAMDTYMTITAYGKQAQEAVDAAVQEVQRLEQILSAQNPESEIAIANETGSCVLSEDTMVLMQASMELYQSTDGLFDITIYPLMQEWGFYTQKYHVPEKARLKELLQYVDASKLTYDSDKHLLTLPDGMKADLGGIAKGYTSGRIMEIYGQYGIRSGIVSLGGNIQTYGTKTDGALADGLSTSLFIMGADRAEEYWKSHADDFDFILAKEDGSLVISEGIQGQFSTDLAVAVVHR